MTYSTLGLWTADAHISVGKKSSSRAARFVSLTELQISLEKGKGQNQARQRGAMGQCDKQALMGSLNLLHEMGPRAAQGCVAEENAKRQAGTVEEKKKAVISFTFQLNLTVFSAAIQHYLLHLSC